MDNTDIQEQLGQTQFPLFRALVLLSLSILGFVAIGPLLGMLLALLVYSGDLSNMQSVLTNPMGHPEGKILFFILQSSATIGMFLVPLAVVKFNYKIPVADFFKGKLLWVGLLLAAVITIAFMGVNAVVIEWNSTINLPDFMEEWAKNYEAQAKVLVDYLTNFDNVGQLAGAMFVMAILPAIGEEFVFRGMLQNQFAVAFRNKHLAIWVSAILFSAIHMQFYGFVPRVLLGALFGYLYLWSENLLVPILAHFVNNGFTLVMLYMHKSEIIDYDLQNSESPTLASVVLFSIITFGLVYYFRKLYLKHTIDGNMAKGI